MCVVGIISFVQSGTVCGVPFSFSVVRLMSSGCVPSPRCVVVRRSASALCACVRASVECGVSGGVSGVILDHSNLCRYRARH